MFRVVLFVYWLLCWVTGEQGKDFFSFFFSYECTEIKTGEIKRADNQALRK